MSNKLRVFHVVPGRTGLLDFEVHQVLKTTEFGVRSDQQQDFLPMYSVTDIDREGKDVGSYLCLNRVRRMTSKKGIRIRPRSYYPGSEDHVSFVDGKAPPYWSELRELFVLAPGTHRTSSRRSLAVWLIAVHTF